AAWVCSPAPPRTVPTIRNEVWDQQTDTTAPTATAAIAEAPAPEVDAPEVVEGEVKEETQVITDDDLGGMSLADAIDATIVAFDDGDIVTGEVVKNDSDEV